MNLIFKKMFSNIVKNYKNPKYIISLSHKADQEQVQSKQTKVVLFVNKQEQAQFLIVGAQKIA